MNEPLVDFHCHLDLFPDLEQIVRECEARRVYTLAVTTTPRAWARNRDAAAATKHVRAALGIHPQLVTTHGNEIELWEKLLPETRYVGEVGLDAGPAHFKSLPLQREVFRRVLEACAMLGDRILSVHSVRAATPVLDMIEAHLPAGRSKVVLHWFSGSRAEARRAVEMGCWFSVNVPMLRNERTASIITSVIPLDRILTETDGPFAEGPLGPARPKDVRMALDLCAPALGIEREEVAGHVLRNMRGLLTV
ncbi:MAG: TatD family deoxyribonuclease [Mesorhizobium sp.]|uniref:Qat anti-phage system TatD family nuclease QatD n=1 Tax=Mesorhizobium sp. TaxID=1871066 RepID=UPI000FE8682B|nr:Qat anti-phage system TatD family nuclease QatD [Mesorhizobium sp.]RWL81997.1 MAG: TatD family deoxyribonuclease [Mesorhizobium sp.]